MIGSSTVASTEGNALLDGLIATSGSKAERRGLLQLKADPSLLEKDSKQSSDELSRAVGLLQMAQSLDSDSELLIRFYELRKQRNLDRIIWSDIWKQSLRPSLTALLLFVGVGVAISILLRGSDLESLVDAVVKFFLIDRDNRGSLAWLLERLLAVISSIFIGVIPGVFLVFCAAVGANYWFGSSKQSEWLGYRMLIFGKRRMYSDASELLSGVSLLMKSGRSLGEALRICGQASSPIPKHVALELARSLSSDENWESLIADQAFFPIWLGDWLSKEVAIESLPTRLWVASALIDVESRWSASLVSRMLAILTTWTIVFFVLCLYALGIAMAGGSINLLGM